MKTVRETYTLADFVALMTTDSTTLGLSAEHITVRHDQQTRTSHEWMGLTGIARPDEPASAATLRLIREGWTGGVDLMQQVAASVDVPAPVSVRRRSVWGDHGDSVDMQRVYAGNLESAWRRMTKVSSRGPARVRIMVESIAQGTVDSDKMRWRGVAAMRLADALIEAGYSVQVESGFAGRRDNRYHLRVIVKQYTDPLDLSSLAATTALPAFFRALGHEWHPIAAQGRGRCSSVAFFVEKVDPDEFVDPNDDARLFVAGQDIGDASDASGWVAECIRALDAEDMREAA